MRFKGVKSAGCVSGGSGSIVAVNKLASRAILLLAALLALVAGPASAKPVRVEAVEVELVSQQDALVAGTTALLGLRIRHDPEWHTYWRNPGDSGLATEIKLALPQGWQAGGIVWPAPQRVLVGPLASYVFEGDTVLPVPVQVPASAGGGQVRITGRAQWLMCREVCIPGEADLELDLPVAKSSLPSAQAPLFAQAERETPRAALAARASVDAARLSLAFERPGARTAEFFPYEQGWLDAPAPQSLYRVGAEGAGAWRLELAMASGTDRAALAKLGFDGSGIGVLRVDGEAVEVRATLVDATASGGTLVATAAAPPGIEVGGGTAGPGASRFLSGPLEAVGGFLGSSGSSSAQSPPGAPPAPTGTLTLIVALAFSVLGGLILNLMPCVFPVIGLKVLGFARHAQSHRDETRRGALVFSAGVLVSFWVLGGLLLALRAAGEAAGWGFQLQSPSFVALMALLFVAIGMNFAGVFEIGVRLTQLGGVEASTERSTGAVGSFGSGMLAVLVATPCTAPFMSSALGYTLGRPAPEVMLVFTGIAFGMALPYLLLGFFPQALRWLPRPGRWMESFKQFLAFPMFATAAWLAWVLGLQAGLNAVLALSIGAVLVALSAWLYGRFVQGQAAVHRGLAAVFGVLALAAGIWLALPAAVPSGPGPAGDAGASGARGAESASGAKANWEPWSEAKVAQGVAEGRIVFVDFTAAWCVSCQANKALVLSRDPVASEMVARNVLHLVADWTNRDATITAALARHGRNGVPLYLVYRPGESTPRVLPEILTSAVVLDALGPRR
jgi:thiol:disulfide interchange protein DsbD